MRSLVLLLLFVLPALAAEPDNTLTPGVVRDISVAEICSTKWGRDARAVTESMKQQVFRAYGFVKGNADPRCPCEIDHRVSRELGGADDVKNLWPQPYTGPWNARDKDRLENRLHTDLCRGKISLPQAQSAIRDWVASYRKYWPNGS